MTFGAPLLLIGLLAVPLAAAAYVLAQRRRRRFAVRYTNLDLLVAAAGRDPVRHVPAALALLALTALIVALARPQLVVADERREATVVMVTDHSGSMRKADVKPSRLDAAKAAGRRLAGALPQDFRLGLVVFGSQADQLVDPTTDKQRVIRALDGVKVRGATAMGDALALALDAARVPRPGGVRPPARIVLLSDGANTRGIDPLVVAGRARQYRIPVFAVAIGHPTRGTSTLQEVARETGGRFYTAASSRDLQAVYQGLGDRFSKLEQREEVTAAFAGGALFLLVVGSGVGLVRGGRLP